MTEGLGERQAAILRALVREYVRTGEPVGSQHLRALARLNISSATVRNEMARLEELGYLHQPHTSAGRIPTDRAYRFLVDEIKNPKALSGSQRRILAEALTSDGNPVSIDVVLHRASDAAAKFTHHAAAVLARRARPSTLRRAELFPLSSRTAMVVLIAENGRVEQRIIAHDEHLTRTAVERVASRLARDLHGVSLERALSKIGELVAAGNADERALYDGVRGACQALLDADQRVVLGGTANLVSEHDFERDQLYRLYEALERQSVVLELLATALDAPLSVRIGSEMPSADLQTCSLVVANFAGPGGAPGSVGVIGPIRMDYERVIATANTVARLLEGTLGPDEDG